MSIEAKYKCQQCDKECFEEWNNDPITVEDTYYSIVYKFCSWKCLVIFAVVEEI